MDIELTKLQKKHFDSIKWLFDEKRAEGKSYLLAIIFIQKAIRTGAWITPRDHFTEGGRMADIRLNETIRMVIKELISDSKKVEFRQDSFRIN